MLTVIIMILLSITVGVAIKHWELLSEVGELEEELGELEEEVGELKEEVGEMVGDNVNSDYASTVSVVTLTDESAK